MKTNKLRLSLHRIVNKTDTAVGRLFDWAVLALILYSIVTLSVETLPGLSPTAQTFLTASEWVVTLLFTVEYGVRIYVAPRRWRYIFSFFGLIDLIAILPLYLSVGVDLRGVRAFRLFRIIRIFNLSLYNEALGRFRQALAMAKEEIIIFALAAVIVLYLAAIGIYYFEHDAQPEAFKSILHSLWWALSTLTTVGYGDVYPITVGGKVFTALVLMIGLGIVAVPAGLVASALSRVREGQKGKRGEFEDAQKLPSGRTHIIKRGVPDE
jgi:voltage-gated potassium channel